MNDITSLATKIEAAKIAGNGITLSADELTGFLSIAKLLGGGSTNGGTTSDGDEWLTTGEVCDMLSINKQTFYRWRKDGKFTPEPANAQRSRFLRSEVERWLQEQSS